MASYAHKAPINDSGLLGYIEFEVISIRSAFSTISISEININDIPSGGFLFEDNNSEILVTKGVDIQVNVIPDEFALNQNYPNPFTPTTNIQFNLAREGAVKIVIFDIRGAVVDELVNGRMEAGYHQFTWDGNLHASGIYFIQLIADNGNYIKVSKMMLVK